MGRLTEGLVGPWCSAKRGLRWQFLVLFGVQAQVFLFQVRVGPDHTSTPVAR